MSVPNFVERRGLDRLPSVTGFVVRFPARAKASGGDGGGVGDAVAALTS
jgi:hypothetical protein